MMETELTPSQMKMLGAEEVVAVFRRQGPPSWRYVVGLGVLWIIVQASLWFGTPTDQPLRSLMIPTIVGLALMGILAFVFNRYFPASPLAPLVLTGTSVIAPNGNRLPLGAITRIAPIKTGIRIDAPRPADTIEVPHLPAPLAAARAIIARTPHLQLPN